MAQKLWLEVLGFRLIISPKYYTVTKSKRCTKGKDL